MNTPDKYDRTHTAQVPVKVEDETSEETTPKTPKPKAKKQSATKYLKYQS